MAFSTISILVSIAGMITEKQILNDQSVALVEFTVSSQEVLVNMYKLKKKVCMYVAAIVFDNYL